MGIVYVSSFWSIRRFTSHIGILTFRYIVPIFGFWFVLVAAIIFIFRFDYSVWYLIFSSIVSLSLLILFDYINRINKQKIIAYIPTRRITELPKIPYVTWKKLEKTQPLTKQDVSIVMADLRADLSDEWQQFLADCTLKHIPVYHSSRLLERLTGRVKIDHMYENELGALLPSKSYQTIKRILETSLILCSLPIVLPVMIITGLLIMIESRGGMFFLQERIGQGGIPFTVYKFRSMCKDSEKDGSQFAQANDMRVTRIGKFIRKTRIDELPQFFNVLKGEMSLIGPRPEQKKFVEEFNKEIPFYNYRYIVKPGISGWAQVVQGYAADTDDTRIKLEHDFYYIKNFSFSMDLVILFKTIQTMLTGFGAR
ncbi:exopolysaccharide biosynthesis polyprenyl glycosylphosphotransferase [Pasteurella atlantica]|nr:exopolysaccharide biosynthesis polyprenyl glycosylphosphotransferase [Pasteurella atlantica]QVE21823.1 exopolysaccharide biosynthesis polyprenyl glycosylphosphotransferase [Pasteurella atlantica]